MEEIRDHQLRSVVYPIIFRVLYIPGGAGVPASTVWSVLDGSELKIWNEYKAFVLLCCRNIIRWCTWCPVCFHGAFWYSKCLRLLQSQQDAHSMSPLNWNNLSTPFWRSADPASCNIVCAMPPAKWWLKCFICDLLSTTTKRFGNISIKQEWMYILESCFSILEPCWLKKAIPQNNPEHLIHQAPYQPFLRVKLLDSKTWDVFGRHQKRCTSRWCTARAVVCRRTAVQVLWNRASGDCKLAAAFTGLIVFDIFDIVEPYYIRQLHVSCRIL